MTLIDPANVSTWPGDVLNCIKKLAAECQKVSINTVTTPAYDLRLATVEGAHEAEQAFRRLLGDRAVALFHATRLLPHETSAIRRDGLLVLSEGHRGMRLDVVIEKYGDACGKLQLERLRRVGPVSWDEGQRAGRLGRLCGVTPLQAAFDGEGEGMTVFLDHWGGESFYWAAEQSTTLEEVIDCLTALSTPAVVEVGIQAADVEPGQHLWKVFVAQLDNRAEPYGEFHTLKSIPPERVFAVLDPTSDRWPI